MYSYGNQRWTNEFAGILSGAGETANKKDNAFVNTNNDLQFYIKIISMPPENFPREVEEVACFGQELEKWGFDDDLTLTNDERKEALAEFLSNYVLFFSVERVQRGAGEFYNARNIAVLKKSQRFNEEIFLEPIPIFSDELNERTQEYFEQQLVSEQFVGFNKQLSKGEDDTPSMILWKEQIEEGGNAKFTLYGTFDTHEFLHSSGFRFSSGGSAIKKFTIKEHKLLDAYLKDGILFVNSENFEELEKLLEEHGEVVKIKSTVTEQAEASTAKNAIVDKEGEFMDIFELACLKKGLYYDKKDLYNFHTAMKTDGLVILAGMSGTGKSKLVRCYAEALKIKNGNSLIVPVRPSWQDDADVIGYVDTLSQLYRPADSGLINVLTHAAQKPDELHIVCFDEMNLARVEHYFSQFLSVLEADENKRVLNLYNDEHNSRIHNSHMFPSSLRIGNNVMFVGTVNLDESTYHFSDKVLDRANVIELKMVSYATVAKMEEERLAVIEQEKEKKKEENNESQGSVDESISVSTYESFKKKEKLITLNEDESKLLDSLHEKMSEASKNLGIGWRIVKQVNNYLINLPQTSPLSREEAFDMQVVQRVLTKIRGSEEQFGELIGSYNLDTKAVDDSLILELLSAMPASYQFTESKKVIKTKAKELRLHGHTI